MVTRSCRGFRAAQAYRSEGILMSEQDSARSPKAYANKEFMHSPDARPIRIMAEFLEPMHRFHHYNIKDTVVFFGSARIRSPEETHRLVQELEARMAAEGE